MLVARRPPSVGKSSDSLPLSHNVSPGGQYDRSIENSLHWHLDVNIGEEQGRTRKDHAAANLGGLRRTALSLLKKEISEKVEIKSRRPVAAWNIDYLRKMLLGK
jgi:hypothetical protein